MVKTTDLWSRLLEARGLSQGAGGLLPPGVVGGSVPSASGLLPGLWARHPVCASTFMVNVSVQMSLIPLSRACVQVRSHSEVVGLALHHVGFGGRSAACNRW